MGLKTYIGKRIMLLFFVLVGISLISFFISHVIPGDPARLMAGTFARPEQIEQVREELGLDKPLYEQYYIYIKNLLHGDLGMSLHTRRSVAYDLKKYFAATFELTTFSMLITILVGVPIGILSALHKNTFYDHIFRLFSLSGVGMPQFWLAMILQLIFSVKIGILPIQGRIASTVIEQYPLHHITGLYLLDSLLTANWPVFKSSLSHILLPSLTLAYVSLAMVARMMRSNMLEVLNQEYILTEKIYGIPEKKINYVYALKNAFIPTLTIIGLSYGYQLAGSVLIENIFSWPGLGRYAVVAIINADYPAIMGVVILSGFLYVIVNLIIDILYCVLDPRIKY